MYLALVAFVFLVCALAVGTAVVALMASARETREENAAQFDPAGKDGRGSDVFGGRL